jgi:hypothetical protein
LRRLVSILFTTIDDARRGRPGGFNPNRAYKSARIFRRFVEPAT